MAPLTPLVSPRAYYDRGDRPSPLVGAGAVLARAVAFAVVTWWFVGTVLGRIDAGPRLLLGLGAANQALFAFLVAIIGWLLLATSLHVVVWFADGEGEFPATLTVVAETELVSLLLVPVVAVVFVTAAGDVPADPVTAVEWVQELTAMQTPLLLLAGGIATLWKAAIAGVGLSAVHGIAIEKTMTAAVALGLLAYATVLLL